MAQENTTSSKDEVLKIISSINNKKKRADSKSIFLAANDTNISSEEIESIVEELCNEEKLKIIKRAGKVSYRVCNNNKSKIDEERDEIGKLSSVTVTVMMTKKKTTTTIIKQTEVTGFTKKKSKMKMKKTTLKY